MACRMANTSFWCPEPQLRLVEMLCHVLGHSGQQGRHCETSKSFSHSNWVFFNAASEAPAIQETMECDVDGGPTVLRPNRARRKGGCLGPRRAKGSWRGREVPQREASVSPRLLPYVVGGEHHSKKERENQHHPHLWWC